MYKSGGLRRKIERFDSIFTRVARSLFSFSCVLPRKYDFSECLIMHPPVYLFVPSLLPPLPAFFHFQLLRFSSATHSTAHLLPIFCQSFRPLLFSPFFYPFSPRLPFISPFLHSSFIWYIIFRVTACLTSTSRTLN